MYHCDQSAFTNLVEVFSALLTPTLAIIGATILVLQYYLQKLRWRLDLYDKRYPVYQSTMEYISYVLQRSSLTDDEWWRFLRNSKDKSFLFGKDVQTFLESLYNKGLDLNSINEELKHTPVGEERNNLVKRKDDVFQWFKKQFDVSKNLFGKYLTIAKK